MGVDTEFPALATVRHPTSPSPAAYQSRTPSPSIATPDQITVHEDDNSTQFHLPIPNPVASLKRAAQYSIDSMTQSANNEANQILAYLPKEMRDVIQMR